MRFFFLVLLFCAFNVSGQTIQQMQNAIGRQQFQQKQWLNSQSAKSVRFTDKYAYQYPTYGEGAYQFRSMRLRLSSVENQPLVHMRINSAHAGKNDSTYNQWQRKMFREKVLKIE